MPTCYRAFSLLAASLLLGLTGCVSPHTTFTPNPNPVVQSGGSGKVTVYRGAQIWRGGSPERPYEVIGTVTDRRLASPDNVLDLKVEIAQIVKERGGDGVIMLSSHVRDITQQVTTAYPVYDPFMYGPEFGPPFDPAFGLTYYPAGDFFYPPTEAVTQNVEQHILVSTFKVFRYVK